MVIKAGNAKSEFTAQKTPVTGFIAVQLFRREVGVGIESREIGCPVRGRPDIAEEIKVLLGIGRGSPGVCKRRPNALMFVGSPKKPRTWFRRDPLREIGS